jgi:hypothetical protein
MRQLFAGLLIAAAVTGCALWQQDVRRIQFDNTTRAYARHLEWSDFEKLVLFAAGPGQPAPDPALYRDIKITSYQPADAVADADGRTVRRPAQIRYVLLSRMSERSVTVEEEWAYFEDAQRWYLKSGLLPPVVTPRPQ